MTYGSIALRPAHGAHLCLLQSEIHLMTIDGATYDHRMEQPMTIEWSNLHQYHAGET